MIEAGIREGTLRQVDSTVLSHVLVSMAVGIVLQGILDPHAANWEQVTREAVKLFIHAIAKEGK